MRCLTDTGTWKFCNPDLVKKYSVLNKERGRVFVSPLFLLQVTHVKALPGSIFDRRGKRKAVVTKWPWRKLKGLTASGSEKQQDSVCCLSPVSTGMCLSQVPHEWVHDDSSHKSARKTQIKWPKVPKESHSFAGLVPPCSSDHKSNPGRLSKQAPEVKRDFPRKETMPNSWL